MFSVQLLVLFILLLLRPASAWYSYSPSGRLIFQDNLDVGVYDKMVGSSRNEANGDSWKDMRVTGDTFIGDDLLIKGGLLRLEHANSRVLTPNGKLTVSTLKDFGAS